MSLSLDAAMNNYSRENFSYAATGQRTLKTTSFSLAKGLSLHQVRYLPLLEIRRHKANNRYSSRQVVSVAEMQILRSHSEHGQLSYSLSGLNHHRMLEVDGAGQIISRENYYPFGGTACWATRRQCNARYKTLRYGGKERDLSGLIYYGYRYYLPWLLRWLNADPARDVDGLNLMWMCRNNPVSGGDEDGRMFAQNPGQPSASYIDPFEGAPEVDNDALEQEERKLIEDFSLPTRPDPFATSTVVSAGSAMQNAPLFEPGWLPPIEDPQPALPARQMVYNCNQCGAAYPYLEELMEHRELCQPSTNFVCIECGTRFHYAGVLAAHRAKYHPESASNGNIPASSSTFPSSEHVAEDTDQPDHRPVKPYGCNLCKMRFNSYDDREKHTEGHSLPRNFTCDNPGCGKRFLTQNYLRQHKIVHSDMRFACTYANCKFLTAYNNNLTRHMKKKHGYEIRRGGKRY
jgi:RHS repeat-associated protein